MVENLIQSLILISSGIAIYLISRTEYKWQLSGCFVGLIGQAFWFYETIKSEQWGIFLLTCWYTFCYINGIWKRLIKGE